jgi:phage gp36-like protein
MFISPQDIINKIGMNVLLQFVSGKSFDVTTRPTKDDVEQALLVSPDNELQQQIHDWYVSSDKSVTALITGYVSRFSLTQAEIDASVLPSIATDLMRYELCTNPNDEQINKRREVAMKQLDKIEKGVIRLTQDKHVARTGMRTTKPRSQFNWDGY